jgi:hypothetical protein
MANFIVIPLPTGNQILNELIPERFGKDSFALENGDWLVSFSGTSKQLSEEIGVSDGANGGAVVLNFSGYWGYATNDIWEWINEHSK